MFGFVSSVLAEKGRQVYTTSRGTSVAAAVAEMNQKGVGALLVVEGEHPVGIFTERDVLVRVVDADLDPAQTRVNDVMTRDPITVSPGMHVDEAMELMTTRRCRHLPVCEDGRLVGMLSIGDILRWMTLNQEDYIRQMTHYISGAADSTSQGSTRGAL